MEQSQIIIYQAPNGETTIDVKIENETIWLTLTQIAVLFNKNKSTISRHLNNIYQQEELMQEATVAKNATVQLEGNRTVERTIEYYNLDAIISVGYRVNSKEGTRFRIWANQVLKEYLTQAYAVNKKLLLSI